MFYLTKIIHAEYTLLCNTERIRMHKETHRQYTVYLTENIN